MKLVKNTILALGLMVATVGVYSCGHQAESGVSKTSKEYTSAYVCPMHCAGSGSDQSGKCPKCKMDYVANENTKATKAPDAHSHEGHDHGHEGHDHSHEGHNHEGHNH